MPTVVITDQLPPAVLSDLLTGLVGHVLDHADAYRARGVVGLRIVPTTGGFIVEGLRPEPVMVEIQREASDG